MRSMQASATSSSRPHHCPERRAGSSSSAHTMTGWHLLTPEFRGPHVLPAGKFLLCQKGFSPFSPGEGLGTLCRGNISTSLHQMPQEPGAVTVRGLCLSGHLSSHNGGLSCHARHPDPRMTLPCGAAVGAVPPEDSVLDGGRLGSRCSCAATCITCCGGAAV